MYGLEKGKRALFEFDLEKELKADPNKASQIVKKIESKVQEVKNLLKAGGSQKELDELGAVLQGYTALQRVLSRLSNKK